MTKNEAIKVLKKYTFEDEEMIANDIRTFDSAICVAIEALSNDIIWHWCETPLHCGVIAWQPRPKPYEAEEDKEI